MQHESNDYQALKINFFIFSFSFSVGFFPEKCLETHIDVQKILLS